MSVSSSVADVTAAEAGDAFLSPASIRQSPDGLGPRARRTVASIISAAREVFLTKGYAGTTIDEIARVADVSRASVYTYFPSKREVLFAVGARGAVDTALLIESLAQRPRTRAAMVDFVVEYFRFLDVHGSFSFAWTQAARADDEIRITGMKRHLSLCRRFGELLAASAGRTFDAPEIVGMVAWSTLERGWNFADLYQGTIERDLVIRQIAETLWAVARAPG
jgi:TetR/AcrR family transcriptional regulator